ncbi:hypothetical protein HDV05_000109 [Chytridiales sp. JEL 0842]|nr:hypothetical protein HDV05_000109 [Chytridiales sp. JEL 0842]
MFPQNTPPDPSNVPHPSQIPGLTSTITFLPTTPSIQLAIQTFHRPSPSPTSPKLTFLFAHANGLCKEVWNPVIKILADRFPDTDLWFHSYDARNMGDSALRNRGSLGEGKPVTALDWWEVGWDAVKVGEWVRNQRGGGGIVVGVGHSFGAVQMLMLQILKPGLLDSIVCIEPVIMSQEFIENTYGVKSLSEFKLETHVMGQLAIKRRAVFESKKEAFESFRTKPFFQSWTEEATWLYVNYALYETANPQTGSSEVRLKCAPEYEAATFLGGSPPEIYPLLAQISIPVRLVAGKDSNFSLPVFQADGKQGLFVGQAVASKVQNGSFVFVEDAGHMVVMERKEAVADDIYQIARRQLEGKSVIEKAKL